MEFVPKLISTSRVCLGVFFGGFGGEAERGISIHPDLNRDRNNITKPVQGIQNLIFLTPRTQDYPPPRLPKKFSF
jgi:hypothetical protein